MTTLTITLEQDVGAKALVRAALDSEVRILESALKRTQSRIRAFEDQFKMATAAFIASYESGDIEESLDTDEWIGEHRMLKRLQDSRDALREARLAD